MVYPSPLAHVESFEGTITATSSTLSFSFAHTRRVIASNDSATDNLTINLKVSDGQDITLKSGESLDVEYWTNDVFISTTGTVQYRVWMFG